MKIHVVASGDSLFGIGQRYGMDYRKIARDNEVGLDQELVVGQTIVVVEPAPSKIGVVEMNGYAYPNVTDEVLGKTMPGLTYLSVFSYEARQGGEVVAPPQQAEERVIRQAVAARVMPVMVLSNIGTSGNFEPELAKAILNNPAAIGRLLDNLVRIMHQRGYNGLDVDFEYVPPEDGGAYENFLETAAKRFSSEGFSLSCAIPAKEGKDTTSKFAGAYDYSRIGAIVDLVTLMTYDWGHAGSAPMAVAPLPAVERVIRFASTQMQSSKILMGIPNYGYDWPPKQPGKAIGIVQAVELARKRNQAISYDDTAKAPWFEYYVPGRHEVWFEDARSVQAKLGMAHKYDLAGFSYWNINRFWPQSWLVMDSMYDVAKS